MRGCRDRVARHACRASVAQAPPPLAEDLTVALDLETKILDNLWEGQLYEIDYATPERVPGNIVGVHHFGDSALWTGTYLAAESFRYALAKRKLARSLAPDQVELWEQQRAEALARVRRMVGKFHILANISGSWNHELQPAPHQAPGVDYLPPYWMLRFYTEAARPVAGPFPAWPGPTYG